MRISDWSSDVCSSDLEDLRMNEARKIVVEEVDAVEAPPKARVESAAETFERKRDYLEGFLAQPPPPVSGGEPGGALYEAVIDALKEIYDPERSDANTSEITYLISISYAVFCLQNKIK